MMIYKTEYDPYRGHTRKEAEFMTCYRYRYSIGIADAWSVDVLWPRWSAELDAYLPFSQGTTYEYGYDAPRYPVPAIVG